MTPSTFIPLPESALQARHSPFTRTDMLAFVEDAWTLIADDPDAERWADAFLLGRSMP